MSVTAVSKAARNAGVRYFELVKEFPLRPIRTKAAYDRAMKIVQNLASHDEGSLAADDQDYLDTLTLLVEEYDRNQKPVDTSHIGPIEVLRHLMEAREMNTTDLGNVLGSKGVASEVLNGKRSLSKAHMANLAIHFGVEVSVFFPLLRKR